MIQDYEELVVIRRQLALAEDALAILRRDIFPQNAKNFAVLSEGYVEQINALRAEIDAYLGLSHSPVRDMLSLPSQALK